MEITTIYKGLVFLQLIVIIFLVTHLIILTKSSTDLTNEFKIDNKTERIYNYDYYFKTNNLDSLIISEDVRKYIDKITNNKKIDSLVIDFDISEFAFNQTDIKN